MRGDDRFTGTRIFQHGQHDALRQPFGQSPGQSPGQPSGPVDTSMSNQNQSHWQAARRTPAPSHVPPEPAQRQPRAFRASSEDRTQVTELLQAHYVAGRLDATELAARVEQALAAVTLADLDAVLADLPPLPSSPAPTQSSVGTSAFHADVLRCAATGPKPFRAHATTYLLVMAMLVAIWALTNPGGYFWPIWPMLGWGIGLASHGLAARSVQQRQRVAIDYR